MVDKDLYSDYLQRIGKPRYNLYRLCSVEGNVFFLDMSVRQSSAMWRKIEPLVKKAEDDGFGTDLRGRGEPYADLYIAGGQLQTVTLHHGKCIPTKSIGTDRVRLAKTASHEDINYNIQTLHPTTKVDPNHTVDNLFSA
jgi:hypothetical protein